MDSSNSKQYGPKSINTDRTVLVPAHVGPHVLPNSPLFGNLLRHARRNRIAIRDITLSIEKSYGDLLDDVLAFRTYLQTSLRPHVLEGIRQGDEVYIGVLAAGGYEYTVAMLTVLSLGAAAVPMSRSWLLSSHFSLLIRS